MSPWNKGRVALETEHGVAQLRCPGLEEQLYLHPREGADHCLRSITAYLPQATLSLASSTGQRQAMRQHGP